MPKLTRGRPRRTSHQQLRDLARGLFADQGFDATSLTQIAKAAGISRTTLFEYFPNKRDLLWEEFDQRMNDLERYLASPAVGGPLEILTAGIEILSAYRVSEHEELAVRLAIVEGSAELRAYTSLQTQDIAQRLSQRAVASGRPADVDLIGDVSFALIAVATRATRDWALQDAPTEDLNVLVARRLEPFTRSLAVQLGVF